MRAEIDIPEEAYESRASDVKLALQRCMNRMGTSTHRYGPVRENVGVVNMLACVDERVGKYRTTGNTEWLHDAINFLLMEILYPQHPDAHFRATETHESPGVIDYRAGEKP